MKILVEAPPSVVSPTMLTGWCQALSASGFEVGVLRDYEHVFDVFSEYKPDVVATTSLTNRALVKCIQNRPRLKTIYLGDLQPAFDSVTYARKGVFNPALACDLAFVAEWTEEKAPLYRSFLDPVMADGRFNVKCFGAGEVCPYPQHMGWLDHGLLPDLYASAAFCLDLSHGRQTERGWQINGMSWGCISNEGWRTADARVVDGEDLLRRLEGPIFAKGIARTTWVITYFDHMAQAFGDSGLFRQADQIRNKGLEYVNNQGKEIASCLS